MTRNKIKLKCKLFEYTRFQLPINVTNCPYILPLQLYRPRWAVAATPEWVVLNSHSYSQSAQRNMNT